MKQLLATIAVLLVVAGVTTCMLGYRPIYSQGYICTNCAASKHTRSVAAIGLPIASTVEPTSFTPLLQPAGCPGHVWMHTLGGGGTVHWAIGEGYGRRRRLEEFESAGLMAAIHGQDAGLARDVALMLLQTPRETGIDELMDLSRLWDAQRSDEALRLWIDAVKAASRRY